MSITNVISKKLFLVVLGGNLKNTNIEQHDVRWVIGDTIEDTFDQLKLEWIGIEYGLHIDSYLRVDFIDGYRVILKKIDAIKTSSRNDSKLNKTDISKKLWFINCGGYFIDKLAEYHLYGLTVAESKALAIEAFRLRINDTNIKLKHKDNVSSIYKLKNIDNCIKIDKVNKWQILLEPDPLKRHQTLTPDWYGYRRIDR